MITSLEAEYINIIYMEIFNRIPFGFHDCFSAVYLKKH